ncbi:MAG: hypothetical protein R6V55_10030 [Desulfovermiculus sp.]
MTGSFFGGPEARQEEINRLFGDERELFILRGQLILCPQASGMRAEKIILMIL